VTTLAARGIRGFTDMLKHHAERAPLRRNVELREVGDAAVFLASRMASGITGGGALRRLRLQHHGGVAPADRMFGL